MSDTLDCLGRLVGIYFGSKYTPWFTAKPADLAFVFARADFALADTVASLYHESSVKHILLTGGVGKDSGALRDVKLNLPEARFLAAILAVRYEVPLGYISLECQATNGGENSRFGIAQVREEGLLHEKVILVGHPTNLLRLYAAHRLEAKKLGFAAEYQLVACDDDVVDDEEVTHRLYLDELLRLADWPVRPEGAWADPVPDLPMDLVERVRAFMAKN